MSSSSQTADVSQLLMCFCLFSFLFSVHRVSLSFSTSDIYCCGL